MDSADGKGNGWRHHGRESLSDAAQVLDRVTGSAWTSGISMIAVAGLLIIGLVVRFEPWWQAVVHSTGALVSLLVLFSIQHTNNRRTQAVLLKLDELIQATQGADNKVIAAEDRDLHDQEHLHRRQRHLHETADERHTP